MDNCVKGAGAFPKACYLECYCWEEEACVLGREQPFQECLVEGPMK